MPFRWLGGIVGVVVLMAGFGAPPARASNDPFFDRQWALDQIGAPQAWTMTRGKGAVIGIVDSGVEASHPDLAGKVALTADCHNRLACVDGLGATDADGHGTMIAGVAAAGTDNGKGIAGVAPDARLVVAKVLGPGGSGRAEDINLGIRWAVDHGAKVVSISLGDPQALTSAGGSPLRDGIEYAWSRGAVPVLAAGNYGGLNSENYGTLNALVVGATDRSGGLASYSSAIGNAKWGLVAPGGSGVSGPDNNIISTTTGGGYASSAGTSMAVPHVSGAIALLLAQGLSPSAAVSKLLATLDRVPCGAGCQGRLNVGAASGAPAASPSTAKAIPAPAPPAAPAESAPSEPSAEEPPAEETAPADPDPTAAATAAPLDPPSPATSTASAPAPASASASASAASRSAAVEPAGLAAAGPGPLTSPAGLDPFTTSVAVGLVLGVGVAVVGVWAQRRPATVRPGAAR